MQKKPKHQLFKEWVFNSGDASKGIFIEDWVFFRTTIDIKHNTSPRLMVWVAKGWSDSSLEWGPRQGKRGLIYDPFPQASNDTSTGSMREIQQ
jgi:hypothetical protein